MATDPAQLEVKVEHLQNTVDQLSAKVDSYHISLVNIVDKKKKKKEDEVRGHMFVVYLSINRLVGLVVKASASRAEGPGFESRLRQEFFGVESYQ